MGKNKKLKVVETKYGGRVYLRKNEAYGSLDLYIEKKEADSKGLLL